MKIDRQQKVALAVRANIIFLVFDSAGKLPIAPIQEGKLAARRLEAPEPELPYVRVITLS
ncbi:MAG: hypothetical protein JW943_05625 [Deltaproteobacteria bacterium]|nr:hypothetical protein [Deltaproteobacteria bacterium]